MHFLQLVVEPRSIRVDQHTYQCSCRFRLTKKLQSFWVKFRCKPRGPSRVSAWPIEAPHKTVFDRVSDRRESNRYFFGGLVRREC
jgi:hypothetical protein